MKVINPPLNVSRTLFNPTRRPAPVVAADGARVSMPKGKFVLMGWVPRGVQARVGHREKRLRRPLVDLLAVQPGRRLAERLAEGRRPEMRGQAAPLDLERAEAIVQDEVRQVANAVRRVAQIRQPVERPVVLGALPPLAAR